MNVLLLSTYEMGRQPFGLASPAAWLRAVGVTVHCADLSIDALPEDRVREADLVAFYVPMHTATRLAVAALARVRALKPTAPVCFFGLYASENAEYLRSLGVDVVLGGEFESGLAQLVARLAEAGPRADLSALSGVSLDRQAFLTPARRDLPPLDAYARLAWDGEYRVVGYTEASRGCKHLCRHCPIVPVYGGRFRIIQPEVTLADIRQQVAAGAQHITFGDPDFFNGPRHAARLVEALHAEFPALTYDVTIKVEHLLQHAALLPTLKATGCLFITTAVESFDERVLTLFAKHHTRADFERALALCDAAGLLMVPTFVAFTPWTTLAGYRAFLADIARYGLVERVAPIQYAIRLLIPPGSRLLELAEVQAVVEGLDQARLSYVWRNPDPCVDALQQDLERLVQAATARHVSRQAVFGQVWERAWRGAEDSAPTLDPAQLCDRLYSPSTPIPHLTEPWYC